MTIVAVPATVGNWVDSDEPLSSPVLQQIRSRGYVGVMRYVPLPGNNPKFDITEIELDRICEHGLDALLIQHVRLPGWVPDQHSGHDDAVAAIAGALSAGYPPGCHLGTDVEGVGSGGTRLGTIGFLNDWAATTCTADYRAMAYVGYDVPLTSLDWWNLPQVTCYWSDAGPRHVDVRSFAIRQSAPVIISGVKFDRDTVAPDLLGSVPVAARWAL